MCEVAQTFGIAERTQLLEQEAIFVDGALVEFLFWRETVAGKTHHIGTTKKEHDDPVLLIIDGQQRLTALYAVFRNQLVKDENYDNRRIVIAFNPATEEFKVADATTARNSEYVNNISDFLTRASTRTFINGYIEQLKKYYKQLSVKQVTIRAKLAQGEEFNRLDADFIATKIKGLSTISDAERAVLEKLEEPPVKDLDTNDEEDKEGSDNQEFANEKIVPFSVRAKSVSYWPY